jgi:hypothetical protein
MFLSFTPVHASHAYSVQMLTATDLHHDPILVRKIKRLQAQATRIAEESDIDDDEDEVQHRGSQKVRGGNVKAEPKSSRMQVPATQEPLMVSQVEDLGSPSADEDGE